MGPRDSKVIKFRDRSKEFQPDKGREPGHAVNLPNPHYLRIHAAVAGILHMSGAGKFFDELLGKFGEQDGSSAVRSWEEFDRVVETVKLRQELSALLVH